MKNKMIHSKKYILLLFFLVTTSVLFLSVGYSTFQQELLIEDIIAYVKPDMDVRITEAKIENVSNNAMAFNTEYNVSSIVSDLTLPESSSSVTFSVSAKNYGNVEVGIKNISLPPELEEILEISVVDYSVGDKLRDDNNSCENSADGCKLSINRSFDINVKYKDGAYNSNSVDFSNFKLNFEFVEAMKVTYTGFTVLKPSEDMNATSVLKGNDHYYNIGYHEELTVKEGGRTLSSDRYSVDANNNLVVTNVQDNLEIIITEIMIPVKIEVKYPTTATIKYSVNSGLESSVTGVLNTSVPRGSSLSIKVSATSDTIRYKSHSDTFTNIISDLNEEITLTAECDVNITTKPSSATIKYSINDGAEQTATGTLTGTYAPGTKLKVKVSNSGYASKTKEYEINSHITETIELDKVYSVNINSNPTDATIKYSVDGGAETTVTGSISNLIVSPGAKVSVTVSRSGYVSKTENYTINDDLNTTITLTKYPTVKITPNPSDATIKYTVNGGAEQTVTGALSGSYAPGTVIAVTVSKTGYQTKTASYTVNSDLNETITLTKILTYTVNSNISSNIKLEYNGTSTSCNSATTCSISVPSGSSIKYTVSANYYNSQSSTDTISSNYTRSVTLSPKATKTINISPSNAYCSKCTGDGSNAWDGNWDGISAGSYFLTEARYMTFDYTNFNELPADGAFVSMYAQYKIDASGKPTVSTTLSVGSSQCASDSFTFPEGDPQTKSITCYNTSTSTLKSSTVTLKVQFSKVNAFSYGYWYETRLVVSYIPI